MSVAARPFVPLSTIPPEALPRVGQRIANARRLAGLSQAELAQRVGASAWLLDRFERGERDPGQVLVAIAAVTSQPYEAFVTGLAGVGAASGEAEGDTADQFSYGGIGPLMVGIVFGVLVLIRFFSEKIGILPRAVTFIDVPLFLGLVTISLVFGASVVRRRPERMRLAILIGGFFIWSLLAMLSNLERIAPGPTLLFIYGFVSPVVLYYAVYRLWQPGSARWMVRLLVLLGILQLVVGALYDLPRFLRDGNPDLMSGTFGENGYQMAMFLMMVISVVAGSAVFDRGTFYARFAPALIGAMILLILLVQFRALLVTMVLTLLLVGLLLTGGRLRGVAVGAVVASLAVFAFGYVTTQFTGLKYGSAVERLVTEPGVFVDSRLRTVTDVSELYSEDLRYLVTGTGPGTFSSRAWRTFGETSRTRTAVAASFAERLNGGRYVSDVAERYTLPRYFGAESIEGSRAATLPFASWMALAAEVGVPGLLLLGSLYVLALAQAFRIALTRLRRRRSRDPVLPLALGAITGLLVLVQAAVLENWLEVTRMTFIAWGLLAIAAREADADDAAATAR